MLTENQLFLGGATYLSIAGTYLAGVVFFELLDKVFHFRRIQRPPSETELRECFHMVILNLSWLLVVTLLSGPALEMVLADYDSEVPTVSQCIGYIAVSFVIHDCWFYFYHRTIHSSPALYKAIHKSHHLFTAPFPAVAFAVHPCEMMLQAFGASLGPFFIFHKQIHPTVFWLWLVLIQLQGMEDHLGYELRWSPTHLFPNIFGGTRFHDAHHQKFKCNYAAVFSILDRIFGTADEQIVSFVNKHEN